jgi:hypothetical protein
MLGGAIGLGGQAYALVRIANWLADDEPGTAETFANRQELDSRMELLTRSMEELSERERHILTERRLIDEPRGERAGDGIEVARDEHGSGRGTRRRAGLGARGGSFGRSSYLRAPG